MTTPRPKFELFFNHAQEEFSFPEVIAEVLKYLSQDASAKFRVFIGSDSLSNSHSAGIVSTIVVYKVGNGGRYFWHRHHQENIFNLEQKIHAEVQCSLELAQKVLNELQGRVTWLPQNLEIHVDVGEKGETKRLINEVTGWIRAYGITPKIKPYSVAATSVADRRTTVPKNS